VSPVFLSVEQVLRLHGELIDTYGGESGIRDLGLLQSALAMPQASFGGQQLHHDLYAMAGAYLYHIVQNHPFLDGNKRTGAATAIIFLAMNNVTLEADEEGLVTITVATAKGEADKNAIAAFFSHLARANKEDGQG